MTPGNTNTITLTALGKPGGSAGVIPDSVASLPTTTDVTAVPAMATVAVGAKPAPPTVTSVPPDAGPELGAIPVSLSRNS